MANDNIKYGFIVNLLSTLVISKFETKKSAKPNSASGLGNLSGVAQLPLSL
jgi:hypothetical protein